MVAPSRTGACLAYGIARARPLSGILLNLSFSTPAYERSEPLVELIGLLLFLMIPI